MRPELHGLLLAAGASQRLGEPKQQVEFHDQPLVRWAARQLAAVVDATWVVTGAGHRDVDSALEGMTTRRVYNPDWAAGMGSSLALGVSALPDTAAAVLVTMCDLYRLDADRLATLVSTWRDAPGDIIAATWEETYGPPVIFPREFFAELKRLDGSAGARRIVEAHPRRRRFQAMPEAAFDLDTPSDLADFRQYVERLYFRSQRKATQ